MELTGQIEKIKALLVGILESQPEYFLVDLKVKPTNNIKVFIDGDQGINIDACIKINRALYKAIEEAGWYPEGDFSLEVSSPGVDSPLQLHRQYVKNKGRLLEVCTVEDHIMTGILKDVTEDYILLEINSGKGKKAQTVLQEIPFSEIKKAVIQIKF